MLRTYHSASAVIGFIEAIGVWVEESLLSRLQQGPYYALMAEECTDVATLEEMSIFCRWVENGLPVEHFIDIVPLKSTDAESIFTALIECLKQKGIKLAPLVGMGFDGAHPFLGSTLVYKPDLNSMLLMQCMYTAMLIGSS